MLGDSRAGIMVAASNKQAVMQKRSRSISRANIAIVFTYKVSPKGVCHPDEGRIISQLNNKPGRCEKVLPSSG
jgi:hypothetical protein